MEAAKVLGEAAPPPPSLPSGSLSEDEAVALGRRLQVFASAKRLRILWELIDGEMRVGELARQLGISSSLTSHQLRIMREAGLTVTRKQGTRVYYRLHDTNLRDLLIAVRAHHARSTVTRITDVAFASERRALKSAVHSPRTDEADAIAD